MKRIKGMFAIAAAAALLVFAACSNSSDSPSVPTQKTPTVPTTPTTPTTTETPSCGDSGGDSGGSEQTGGGGSSGSSSEVPAGFVKVEGATIVGSSKFTNNGYSGVFVANRTVTLSDFYMCDHEVTQSEYQTVMGSNPSNFTGNVELPVEQVSWFDAIYYCNKKSVAESLTPCYSVDGKTDITQWGYTPHGGNSISGTITCNLGANGYRLPTEAEWEYAALGGKAGVALDDPTDYAGTNDSGSLGTYAWYSGNSDGKTHAVKTKTKNGLGLFDMSGNVWEWCWDWYNSSATAGDNGSASVTNPLGASSGSYRVYRGGCWYFDASHCSVADRSSYYPDSRGDGILGFRVVRSAN